jgi:hypothetical protein
MLLRQNSITAHLTNLRLADLRLITAQQRCTGQNLPSELYMMSKSSSSVRHHRSHADLYVIMRHSEYSVLYFGNQITIREVSLSTKEFPSLRYEVLSNLKHVVLYDMMHHQSCV